MQLAYDPALPSTLFTRLKTVTVTIGLLIGFLLLQGCEELGLKDEKKRRPPLPEPEPQPPVVVVTPQANYPIINRLFFEATRLPNEPDPLTQTYSVDVRQLSVLRQSAGQPAEAFAPLIPLGNRRFTQSYVLIEENDRFFLGDPTTTELKQLTSFSEPACGTNGAATDRRLLTDGLGFADSTLIVRYGSPEECTAGTAAFAKLPLTASPLNLPEPATTLEFFGKPLNALDGSILGYFMKSGATLELFDKAGTLVRSFPVDPSIDLEAAVGPAIAYGEDLLLSVAGTLYQAPPSAFVDPALEPVVLATLSVPELDERVQHLQNTNLYYLDGAVLRVVRLADQQVETVADLSSFGSIRPSLQASSSYLWAATQAGELLRVEPETMTVTSVMSGLSTSNAFLAGTNVIFASIETPPAAIVLPQDSLTVPLCSPAEAGCFENARWLFFDHYREDGLTQLPILLQGFGTTTETLVDGATVITNKPAYVDTAQGRFFNASQLTQFDLASGNKIVKFSSGLPGETQVQALSVIEQDFGLIQYVGQPDNPASLPDLVRINIGSRAGLATVGTTGNLAERVLSRSQN
ncbi:MAG: hypothetical protein CME36_14125 [unclassified Hahellaceae]|nr:hypothetical protein [Hahellaceae bacterium]|tara:strand:+ start:16322 stop:18055 length:1734 start_codon:yes stop_codon:yes gene_type:complete